ncbi:MAG: 4-hydroxy-tetrahydrodipicolinate reductase [Bdellovibrionaceae bacterium]|nr:4-hydroxy-tetrahydrodipicolinate reductase [Pseudobdellovibrionaceae bacterium]
MIDVVIAGITGRMGKELQLIAQSESVKVLGGLSRSNPSLKAMIAAVARPQAVIDFSLPGATTALLHECRELKIPLVSGVTGYSSEQLAELKAASREIPVLHSSNMSLGIQMLAKALEALKGADGFDLVIEEVHHRHKKDRPSGTALLLRDELRERTGREPVEIVSLRGGGVIGDHRVMAMSESEVLTFQHTALNRTVFARGACRAARWLVGQKAGLYSLRDVLESH